MSYPERIENTHVFKLHSPYHFARNLYSSEQMRDALPIRNTGNHFAAAAFFTNNQSRSVTFRKGYVI